MTGGLSELEWVADMRVEELETARTDTLWGSSLYREAEEQSSCGTGCRSRKDKC
jgi:hypothetical protein